MGVSSTVSKPYVISEWETLEALVQPSIDFSEKALQRVKGILSKPENQGKALRIFVIGGGCAGLNYSMALGFVKPDDYVLEVDDHKIVVDPKSIDFLKGMQVDYYESIQSSGFKFNNPNAVASCGCGLSFRTAHKSEIQDVQPCH